MSVFEGVFCFVEDLLIFGMVLVEFFEFYVYDFNYDVGCDKS